MHAQPRLRPFPALVTTLALAAGLATSACSLPGFMTQPPQTRGNKVDSDQLSQLTPGTSTRADATSLLGSPTAHASFDDNTWIYISEVTKPKIGGTNTVGAQNVVVLTFDQNGVLRGVQKKDADNSFPVAVVERTTPSPGTEATFLQQLLGNIGRFNPAGAVAGSNGVGDTGSRGVSGSY